MKSKLLPIVAAMFAATPKADTLFITSDEQGFTDEEKALDHARYLKDKAIQKFERNTRIPQEVLPESTSDDEVKDRVQLLEQYEELFGKPAAHNIGTKTLKQRIDAKKEELAEAKLKASFTEPKSSEEE